MLALTKKTEYALIAVQQLAVHESPLQSARGISGATGLGLPTVTGILKSLCIAGIVTSERGACGGYRLIRSLDRVSLYELIEAIEGPFRLVQCAAGENSDGQGLCELEPRCPIRGPTRRVHDKLKAFLRDVSLAEMTGGEEPAVLKIHTG